MGLLQTLFGPEAMKEVIRSHNSFEIRTINSILILRPNM